MTPAGPGGRATTDEILIARDGPVLTLTFNRPAARNALTWGMYERLTRACEEVDADDSIRVLVLRGAGGQAFVAGTDIGQFQAFAGAADGLAYERDGDRRIGRLEAVRKPVIAQIQGFAVGAGLRIAAACDLRIATPDARFGAPIARTLGNCLSAEAYARLVDLLGPSQRHGAPLHGPAPRRRRRRTPRASSTRSSRPRRSTRASRPSPARSPATRPSRSASPRRPSAGSGRPGPCPTSRT